MEKTKSLKDAMAIGIRMFTEQCAQLRSAGSDRFLVVCIEEAILTHTNYTERDLDRLNLKEFAKTVETVDDSY